MVLATVQNPNRPTADRSSGRRTRTRRYHVRCGGYEGNTFAVEGFIVEVPDTYLGLGTRDRIFAAAAERCPGKDVLEFEHIGRPIAA